MNTLLRAFSWLNKKYYDVKLVVIGDGVESIKNKLERHQNVVVIPRTSNVHKYLNLFDCYVTSSTTETTSLATLEAMSSGLCVVSTPVGFISEYIDDNKNGFLFPVSNAFVLFKYLELLKNNSSLKNSVGSKARKTVLKRFTWEKTAVGIKDSLNLVFED